MTVSKLAGEAERLTDGLVSLYADYQADCDRLEQSETVVSRLSAWLGGGKKAANDPVHMKFFRAVEAQRDDLAGALEELAPTDPETVHRCALRAVTLMLNPVPDRERDLGGRMRQAAEPLSAPLLRWLTEEELQGFRERFLAVYPKRRLFPAQKELLTELDAQISRKKG